MSSHVETKHYLPIRWVSGFDSSSLSLIIFTTEKCNFRCKYCYESFEHGKLTQSALTGINALIEKRAPDLNHLSVSFFGGEPLLNQGAISDIASKAKALAKRHNFSFVGSVTSNGYLLSEKNFIEINELGITNYQITLDGLEEEHNLLRPLSNGKGSFSQIMANIEQMAKSDKEFLLIVRMNYLPTNYTSLKLFLCRYKHILADSRVKVHFHPVFSSDKFQALTIPEKKEYSIKLYEEARQLGLAVVESSFNWTDEVCYASKANHWIIRSDGRIQKCTVAVENSINTVGKITEDGSLNLNLNKLKKWIMSSNKKCPLSGFKASD